MNRFLSVVVAGLVLAGCSSFPESRGDLEFDDGLSAEALFERVLAAHGGDLSDDPRDFNLAMTGEWKSLIQRVQPLVTDAGYRVSAEERYRPADDFYAARHQGPEGVKTVIRQGQDIQVWYDGEPVSDPDVLAATAMTTDAFLMFHFGPSLIARRATAMIRMENQREGDIEYPRLFVTIRPGFGEAESDDLVLWIDPDTERLFRVHMTLNGFRTTQGAHVDTTFSDYQQVAGYWLPSRFAERVRGPIRINAHDWWITARDQQRGWSPDDIEGPEFGGSAAAPAGSGQE